jgi:hypothetical protein
MAKINPKQSTAAWRLRPDTFFPASQPRSPAWSAVLTDWLSHKSQGSEFPAIVTPLAMQQYLLLQRNLVYTGITRGKSLVVLIGQRKALGMAVKNSRTENRFSGLLCRLQRVE